MLLAWTLILTACGDEEYVSAEIREAPPPAAVVNPLTQVEPLPEPEEGTPLSARLTSDHGFRSDKLGTPRKAITGLSRRMKWDDDKLGLKAYARNKEYRSVGAAKIDRIVYRFHQDQLFSVELFSEDLIECSTLGDVLAEMYGPSQKTKTGFSQVAWFGEDVTLTFTNTHECSGMFTARTKHAELLGAQDPAPAAAGGEAGEGSAVAE